MVFINEWLPSPYESSTAEFVELFNKSDSPVSLSNWKLAKANGKTFSLDGYSIPANGYLVLSRNETKLALKNSNEGLALYDALGRRADTSSFDGSARKGKSFSRVSYDDGPAQHFTWASPTSDANNQIAQYNSINAKAYSFSRPINDFSLGFIPLLFLLLAAAAILAALMVYCLNHATLFFFNGRDEKDR